MEKVSLPLVSVAVITYNSSKTVLETLNSIADQTYPNLELIISDDCSKDNTVELCREWLEAHEERFVRSELLTIEKNTGVSANMNRAEEACRGEWVKPIAGDDVLLPECVETYVSFVKNHQETIYAFCRVEGFGDNQAVVDNFVNRVFDYSFFNLSIEAQYEWLITKNIQPIPAATGFFNRNRIIALGVDCDERIPMLEDWPRWIRLLEKKVRFSFVDKILVKYRVSENSLCSGEQYNDKFKKSLALMYFYYQHEPNKQFVGFVKDLYRYSYNMVVLYDKWYWRIVYYGYRIVTFPKRMIRKNKETNC